MIPVFSLNTVVLQRATTERTPSERLLLLKEFEARKLTCVFVCECEYISIHFSYTFMHF